MRFQALDRPARRRPLLLLVLAVLGAGLAVFVSLWTGSNAASPPRGDAASRPAGAPAPRAASPSASPPPAAPVRALSVDEAIRQLDLVRPSRQKLAQDFSLAMPDGGTFRLGAQRGKVVFVNFWATWCPPCREEMPAMERLWQRSRDRKFVMIAVSLDSDPAVVPSFIRNGGFTFPVAVDPKLTAANAYGVRALPSSFLVDGNGYMAAVALGPRAWDREAAIALVEGLPR